jgi:hypothetical protein
MSIPFGNKRTYLIAPSIAGGACQQERDTGWQLIAARLASKLSRHIPDPERRDSSENHPLF